MSLLIIKRELAKTKENTQDLLCSFKAHKHKYTYLPSPFFNWLRRCQLYDDAVARIRVCLSVMSCQKVIMKPNLKLQQLTVDQR